MFKLRKKGLIRIISLITVMTVMLTCLTVFNASAAVSVEKKSFYESFDDYADTATVGATNFPVYHDWNTVKIVGQTSSGNYADISVVDTASSKGNALNLKFTKTTTDKIDIFGLSRSSGVVIGNDDIIISGDVYIPAANKDDTDKQYVRFYVSRGEGTVSEPAADGWTAYIPNSAPAFGLFFTKNNGGDTWAVGQLNPRKDSPSYEYTLRYAADNTAYSVTGDTWYKLDYVYRWKTNTVDYYINGEYINSSFTGEYTYTSGSDSVTENYEIPNHTIGGKLGNIVLAAGGKQQTTSAAKFDEVSVKTVSLANNVVYDEIANGSSFINLRWDIPVVPSSVKESNITVTVLDEGDVTFSGDGATTLSNYTIKKDAGGIGIEFDTPLTTSYGRYQVKVTDATDIFGNSTESVYNCVVGDAVTQKQSIGETFDTNLSDWTLQTTTASVEYDTTEAALKASVTKRALNRIWKNGSTYFQNYWNIAVDDTVEYMDVSWDMKATYGVDNNGEKYKTYFSIIAHDGTNIGHVGVNIQNNMVELLKNGDVSTGYTYTGAGINENVWTSYKFRYYPWTGTMEVYTAANQSELATVTTPILAKTDDSFKWTSADSARLRGFHLAPISLSSVTYFDNFNLTTYGYSASGEVVKAAVFEAADGKMLQGNFAGANTVKLHLANVSSEPTVELYEDGSTVGFEGDFDTETGIYTMTLDKMLVGNTGYSLYVENTIDDLTFTTGEGTFKVSDLRFVNDSDEEVTGDLVNGNITAAVDVYNSTNTTENPYLIWAAYKGSELMYVDYVLLGAESGDAETVKGLPLTVIDDYTRVEVFLWDGFTALEPLLEDVCLQKAAN